jgi:hypothetical protein
MTKPSASLPVLYARVPVETYALAQLLSGAGKTSLSKWIADLIETQRGTLGGQPLPPYAQPVAAEHEPGYAVAAVAPVKRGRGRPRKPTTIDREDGHARAAEAACSSGDDQ